MKNSAFRLPSPDERAVSLLTLGAVVLLSLLASALDARAQLGVGEFSDDVEFAVFDGNTLTNHKLSDYGGRIVVLYYYTPW